MKKVITLLAFFSSIVLYAQANKNYEGIEPEVYLGSKALVFSYIPFQSNLDALPASSAPVSSGDNLEEIQIKGIGFKYFFSNRIGSIITLGFGSVSTDYKDNQNTKHETSANYIGLAVDINYHFSNLYNISSYFGITVNYGLTISQDKQSYASIDLGEFYKEEFSGTSIGFGLNLGFDWYFTEGISLGGKYTLGLKKIFEPELEISEGTDTHKQKGRSASFFAIGAGTITLSVHF